MRDVELRAAVVDDAPSIVRLIRHGFQPDVVSMFIYGAPGIEAFVAEQIAATSLGGDSAYFVADAAGSVVGCIEMRVGLPNAFLNYVAVDPEHARARLASRLLRHALEATAVSQLRLELDVLEDNVPATTWYDRLGLVTERRTGWYRLGPAQGAPSTDSYQIVGLPQARACHRAYGFSHVSVVTRRGTYGVGLLGDRWFRVTNADALADQDVQAALARLDPSRHVFALVPVDAIPNHTPFLVTQRRVGLLAGVFEASGAPS